MNALTIFTLGIVGPWQIVLIVLVFLLLFGGKKIPELMRGLGKGVKEFKKGMDEVERNISDEPAKKNDEVLEPDKIEKLK